MKLFIEAWADFVIDYRRWVILLGLIFVALCSTQLSKLYFDNSNERWFVEGDDQLVAFDRSIELFGDSHYLVVGIAAKTSHQDVFHADTIEVVAQITEFLEAHSVVTQVRSLSNYQYTRAQDGVLTTKDLFEHPRGLNNQSLAVAREVMSKEILPIDLLITADRRHTRVAARVEFRRGDVTHLVKLMHDFYAFSADKEFDRRGYPVHMAGRPVISERFKTTAMQDSVVVNPILLLILLIILMLGLRNAVATVLPVLVIAGGLLVLMSIQGAIGFPMTVVMNAMPPTMVIIGMGLSIHILLGYYQCRVQGMDSQQAAKLTIRHKWQPAFYTAVTTSIGFMALSVTQLAPIREFAWLGAFGCMMMFLLSLTVLPAILSYTKRLPATTSALISSGVITRLTHNLAYFTDKHKRFFVLIGVGLVVFSVITLPRVTVDSNFVNYFASPNQLKNDVAYFDKHYRGSRNLEVIIDSGSAGGAKEPGFLTRVDALQVYLESLSETGESNSLVDYVKRVGKVLHDDDNRYFSLPESRDLVAQYLLLYELSGTSEDLTDMQDFDEQALRLSLPFHNMTASDMAAIVAKIRHTIATDFADLAVAVTGPMMMMNVQNNYVSDGLPKSFIITLSLIGFCFVVMFGSLKYGVIALIPSVVPILVAAGVAGVANIPLDMGTMIVAAVTMGIAVDDTIHVMNPYLSARRDGTPVYQAIDMAMRESGSAVIFTSIILVTGFCAMLFADFKPIFYMGLFSSLIMLLALAADLFVLPALLHMVDGADERVTDKAGLV